MGILSFSIFTYSLPTNCKHYPSFRVRMVNFAVFHCILSEKYKKIDSSE
jgi:hypothetical protein